MANFLIWFKHRVDIEGSQSLDKTDDGNWTGGKEGVGDLVGTTWGVTAQEYAQYLGKHKVSFDEMKNLPIPTAQIIFKANYWDKVRGDELLDQGIASDLADAATNQGLGTGIRDIQEAARLPITGHMDDNTLNHLNNKI
jgi:lysozyme family protein